MEGIIFFAIIAIIVLVAIIKTAVIVPQKTAFIVERLGRYRCTLDAGFHILIPFLDRISYRHNLKEQAIDVPPQECITKDNIAVSVDGVLYMQVMDPAKASYGIGNYLFATTQLAQTTMRSEMGKLDLDRSFEERTAINQAIVSAIDKASDPWGIKVTRYEIKNITPPQSIRDAMEKQMRAERERREAILRAEGEKRSQILIAEGKKESQILNAEAEKQAAILLAEAEKEKKIREGQGEAESIMLVQKAMADSIRLLNEAAPSREVLQLKAYESFIKAADGQATKIIIPSEIQGMAGLAASVKELVKD